MSGRCVDCGAAGIRRGTGRRCARCSSIARATTARDGELQCTRCHQWKPDDDFPHNRSESRARRGRHSLCRSCSTIARREYREAQKIPCVRCGTPRLPKSESGRRGRDTGLCINCYQATRKAA